MTSDIVSAILLANAAREVARNIKRIRTRKEWLRFRRQNAETLAAIYALLPDGEAKATLTSAGRAARKRFGPRSRK